jgi:hypothetical protein
MYVIMEMARMGCKVPSSNDSNDSGVTVQFTAGPFIRRTARLCATFEDRHYVWVALPERGGFQFLEIDRSAVDGFPTKEDMEVGSQ